MCGVCLVCESKSNTLVLGLEKKKKVLKWWNKFWSSPYTWWALLLFSKDSIAMALWQARVGMDGCVARKRVGYLGAIESSVRAVARIPQP
jgi:hypothetical protein